MHISFFTRYRPTAHFALQCLRMQLLSLIFITLAACVSAPPPDLTTRLPEGYYTFDCPIIYKRGMVRLRHDHDRARVELLEKFDGAFSFRIRPDRQLTITDADIDLPGLRRSFRGEGTLFQPGHAEGRAVSWIKTGGPISRNHREGPWTLRPATPVEIEKFQRKQQELKERKARAGEAGLDL
ncbi:MAG: hypothetical protein WD708_10250 [Kiritimatiellia bacterium]